MHHYRRMYDVLFTPASQNWSNEAGLEFQIWYFRLYTKANPGGKRNKFNRKYVTCVNDYTSFTALNVPQYPYDNEVIYSLSTKVVLIFSLVFYFFR